MQACMCSVACDSIAWSLPLVLCNSQEMLSVQRSGIEWIECSCARIFIDFLGGVAGGVAHSVIMDQHRSRYRSSGAQWIRGGAKRSRVEPSGAKMEPSGAEWFSGGAKRSQVEQSGFEVEPSGAEWIWVVLRWSQAEPSGFEVEPSGSEWFWGGAKWF